MPELTYVGEHGLELDPEAEAWAPRIHAFAADAGWPAEDKPLSAAFHYRTAAGPATPRAASLEDVERAARAEGFRTRWGRMVLEVLPPLEHVEGHRRAAACSRRTGCSARSTPATTRPTSTASRRSTGSQVLRCGRGRLDRGPERPRRARADVVVGSTEELARAARAPLTRPGREAQSAGAARARGATGGARRRARSASRRRARAAGDRSPARFTAATLPGSRGASGGCA